MKKKKQSLPPGKKLLQIYRITRQRIQSRGKYAETYDETMDRLLTQFEKHHPVKKRGV